MVKTTRLRDVGLTGLALIGILLACDETSVVSDTGSAVPVHTELAAAPAAERGNSPAAAQVNRELAALRRATAAFHDLDRAKAAGYEVLVTHPVTGAECLDHGEHGGMGYHYLNPSLVNDQVVVDQPEVILYELGPSGKPRMVAVEYIIPFDIRGADETPPVLFGQEFVHNNTFNLWMLHVWVWKNNPSGMFADYNPNVSCD